jgi:hypothetical protein
MNQLEENVVNSFRLAKSDIIQLQSEVIKLGQAQERIMEMLNALHKDEVNLYNRMKKSKTNKSAKKVKPKVKTVSKKTSRKANKIYVSSKTSGKFHLTGCPFAKNIKPKNRVSYRTKNKALNEGLKPCACVA